jgi:hypothetical protein
LFSAAEAEVYGMSSATVNGERIDDERDLNRWLFLLVIWWSFIGVHL